MLFHNVDTDSADVVLISDAMFGALITSRLDFVLGKIFPHGTLIARLSYKRLDSFFLIPSEGARTMKRIHERANKIANE